MLILFNIEIKDERADNIAFGSFFPLPTKPKSEIILKSVIRKAKEILNIPIYVIGEINQNNISKIVHEKLDMISVVSIVFDGDMIKNVHKLL